MLRTLFVFTIMSLSGAALAQVTNTSTKINQAQSIFDLTAATSLNSSLHKLEDTDHELSMDFSLMPTLKLDAGLKLSGYVSANKNLKDERKFEMNDASLSLSKNVGTNDYGKISLKGSAHIPISEQSTKYDKLKAGISLSPKIAISFKKAGIEGLSLSYAPSARVNIHEYKTSISGKSNTQYSLAHTLATSYAFNDIVSVMAMGRYVRSFRYSGNTSDSYLFNQEINFQLNERAGVSIGHVNGGSPLAADGENTDVEFFDERSSSIYTGMNYSF